MKRPVHISLLIGIFGLCITAGIWSSQYVSGYFVSAGWIVCGVFLFVIASVNRQRLAVILVIIAGFLIGAARGGINQIGLNTYQPLFGKNVTVEGTVVEDTAFGAAGDQHIKINNITVKGEGLQGIIWLSTQSLTEIKRSDRVKVSGRLSEGFGNFPAAIYRADLISVERIEYSDVARDIRDKFADGVRKVVEEPQASLGIGYLVGQRTALPEDLTENLRILGLTHIIVASGYNLSILVRFSRRLFAKISKYLTILVGFVLTFSFVLITGLSPSMTRAGLVTGLCLVAWYFGRAIHPLVLLPFAACVTALINPAYVWGDLGWYLSFAAFGGVIVLSPLLIHYFWGAVRPNSLLQILVETVSAQLATMPIIALAFGQYAPLAIVSNLLVLPLVAFAMAATSLAAVAGLILGSDLYFLGLPAQWLLGYMTWIVDKLAQFPLAVAEISFSTGVLVACYIVLISVCIYLYRRTRHDFHEDNIIE